MKAIRLLTLMFFVMAGALLLGGQNHALAQAKEWEKFPDFTIRALGDPSTVITNPVSTNWRQTAGPACDNIYHCYRWTDTDANGSISYCDTLYLEQIDPQDSYCIKAHVRAVTVTDSLDVDGYLTARFPCPGTPTMTQWGMIILVALLIASTVFIMLRRRKAAVPA